MILLAVIFTWRCVFATSSESTEKENKKSQNGKPKSKSKKKNIVTTKSGRTVKKLKMRWPPGK